jgi:hypothetical protein
MTKKVRRTKEGKNPSMSPFITGVESTSCTRKSNPFTFDNVVRLAKAETKAMGMVQKKNRMIK